MAVKIVLLVACALALASARRPNPAKDQKKLYSKDQLSQMSHESLVKLMLESHGGHWWHLSQKECSLAQTVGTCAGETVEACKSKCQATAGCMAFSYPEGSLKQNDCHPTPTTAATDIFMLLATPQPAAAAAASVNFPPIWPYPQSFINGTTTLLVDSGSFQFTATTASPDLDAAFKRFEYLFFPHNSAKTTTNALLTGVTVTVADVNVPLQLEADESYVLDIPADRATITITANTVYGAYHGLQTLSQLIIFDFDSKTYQISNGPWHIADAPRFKHREVLVDSSRHFEPVRTLQLLIDSLTYAKINVVHWHIVDSQSFPFDSPTYPSLGSKGSYSPQERYTIEDVVEVIEFARQRGVRVMIEIDNPGHAASWCAGHPEVCPSPTCLQPLNVARNATFDLLEGLLRDFTGGKRGAGVAFDNMFHLGGDEVDTSCWTRSAEISQWLRDHQLTADQGYEYFVHRAQQIAIGQGRDVVGWEEIWNHFGTDLDKSTIIHQWLPGSTVARNATSHGYRVLWSTDGVWYLDGLRVTWQTMYVQEPCDGIPDNLCNTLMLGGGGEMWGETVDTSDIQQTIWPRLAAIAERLWSPRTITSPAAAAARFSAFRCLLNRRGVAAAPANNAGAREAPPGPGGCLDQ